MPLPASQIGHVRGAHRTGPVRPRASPSSRSHTIETDVALARGESKQVGDYTFRFNGGENIEGPNFDGYRGHVDGHRAMGRLSPSYSRRSATTSFRAR